MKKILLRFLLSGYCIVLFSGCENDKESILFQRNVIRNDLEAYAGWINCGVPELYSKDAHSGLYSFKTDSFPSYSVTFSKELDRLSDKPINRIAVGVWAKALGNDANGSLVLSLEKGDQKIAYFEFPAELS